MSDPIEISVGETFYFTHDELAFMHKEDHRIGKVYRAGSAFGVEPGMVQVISMATGEAELVTDAEYRAHRREVNEAAKGQPPLFKAPYEIDEDHGFFVTLR